jgi:putative spermidine/putrescine transport system ATP-binding protein
VPQGGQLAGEVVSAFFMGDRTRLFVAAGEGPPLVVETSERRQFARGDKVSLAVDADHLLVLKDSA